MKRRPRVFLAITVNPESINGLDQIAADKGVSRSAVARWAVEEYLANHLPSNPTDLTNQDGLTTKVDSDLQPV